MQWLHGETTPQQAFFYPLPVMIECMYGASSSTYLSLYINRYYKREQLPLLEKLNNVDRCLKMTESWKALQDSKKTEVVYPVVITLVARFSVLV